MQMSSQLHVVGIYICTCAGVQVYRPAYACNSCHHGEYLRRCHKSRLTTCVYCVCACGQSALSNIAM